MGVSSLPSTLSPVVVRLIGAKLKQFAEQKTFRELGLLHAPSVPKKMRA
jgi:hypothetical protein